MKPIRKTSSTHVRAVAGNSQIYMIIVIIAILVIAVAAWVFFIRPSGSAVELTAPPPPTSRQARPDSAREVISALKDSTSIDYAAAYESAGEFFDSGELADAQLLYFFAARGGNGPAALALAAMYDPVDFDASKSLMDEPDIFQAYKWYGKALEAGETTAAGHLNALRAWTEQAAANGDQKAEQLLLQWEQ